MSVHHCSRGGRLVGARHPIPEAPFDYVWPAMTFPVVGCNHLYCATCHEVVRTAAGVFARDRELVPALFAARDMSAVAGVTKEPGYRLYVCRCSLHAEKLQRDVDDEPGEPEAHVGLPAGWRCGGHAAVELPAAIDGEVLATRDDVFAVVAPTLLGTRAQAAPKVFRKLPWVWPLRLHRVLADAHAAEAVVDAACALVGGDDFAVVSRAADLLRQIGGDKALAALRALLLRMPPEWHEREIDYGNGAALGAMLAGVLGEMSATLEA